MISVILVNWNSWGDTLSCIESLLDPTDLTFRVIVVDNASVDDSLAQFERWSCPVGPTPWYVGFARYVEAENRFVGIHERDLTLGTYMPSVYFVSSGRNGGFGFGCNVGMRLADTLGTNSYWLLNNDCVAGPGTLQRMNDTVAAQPSIIFGSLVRDFNAPHALQAAGGGRLSRRTGKSALVTDWPLRRPLDYIYGASMAFSARCRAIVGEFDESIFMYYEEIDFCLRASKVGIGCDVVDANVYHKQGGSQGGASSNAWTHVMLNKRYVLHKHFGWGSWTAVYWLSLLLRCIVPLGGAHAATGARRALKALIAKGGR